MHVKEVQVKIKSPRPGISKKRINLNSVMHMHAILRLEDHQGRALDALTCPELIIHEALGGGTGVGIEWEMVNRKAQDGESAHMKVNHFQNSACQGEVITITLLQAVASAPH